MPFIINNLTMNQTVINSYGDNTNIMIKNA